jgi:hypothetical protein
MEICRIEDLSTTLTSVPKNKSQPEANISEILTEQFIYYISKWPSSSITLITNMTLTFIPGFNWRFRARKCSCRLMLSRRDSACHLATEDHRVCHTRASKKNQSIQHPQKTHRIQNHILKPLYRDMYTHM